MLSQVSFLMPCQSNAAEAVNRSLITQRTQPWQAGLACFESMVEAADLLLAHNASFDKQWFARFPASPQEALALFDGGHPLAPGRQLRSLRRCVTQPCYGVPVWAPTGL